MGGFVTKLTQQVRLVEQELLTIPEYLSSPPVYSGVRVTPSLVLCVCFVDRCLSFCRFSFGHSVVCSSSIYEFWLPLWYRQTLLMILQSFIIDLTTKSLVVAPLVKLLLLVLLVFSYLPDILYWWTFIYIFSIACFHFFLSDKFWNIYYYFTQVSKYNPQIEVLLSFHFPLQKTKIRWKVHIISKYLLWQNVIPKSEQFSNQRESLKTTE